MKKILLFFLLLSLLFTDDNGLKLGQARSFNASGDFQIAILLQKESVKISIPSVQADRFVVYRSTAENGKYSKIGNTQKNSFEDKKIEQNKEYYYVVVGIQKKVITDKDDGKGKG
ncbi:hypothetical protein ACFL6D_05175, partial [Spirochaetota bacterium]